jgi:hypothetical protein
LDPRAWRIVGEPLAIIAASYSGGYSGCFSCGYSATNATNTQHTTYKIAHVIVHGMAAASLEFDTFLGVM